VRRLLPGAAFISAPELRERNYGTLEGLRADEIKEKHPKDAELLKSGADIDYAPGGGESKNPGPAPPSGEFSIPIIRRTRGKRSCSSRTAGCA